MTQINLLPWREQARQLKKLHFGLTIVGLIVLALVFIAMLHLYYHHLISAQQDRNNYLQSELDKAQADLFTFNKNKKEQTTIVKELNYIIELRQNNYQAVRLLDELARIVPEGVLFTKITREKDTITILGSAKSNLEVTLFMENLAHSKIFKQPELTEIIGKEGTSGEERTFTLKAEQVE